MPEIVENTKIRKKINLKNDIIFKAFFSRKGNEQYQDIFQEEENIEKQKIR